MIKIFRKIRQNLLSEGKNGKPSLKAGRYLKYAIGEIALVVIGILIALSINNWNEKIKNEEKEYKYLANINKDVIEDSLGLERGWFANKERKIECLELAKQYAMGSFIPEDTLAFIKNVGFGGINSRATFMGSSRTYNELISTGNLSLITNDSIRNLIVQFYNSKDFINVYIDNMRSDYASYLNALRAYNPRNPENINKEEIPRILKKMKADEFHSLINQELTYAYSIERSLNQIKRRSNELHEIIEAYLNIKK